MSFIDKKIFNIGARTLGSKKDVDSQDVSDLDHVFSQPFQNDVEAQEQTPVPIFRKKNRKNLAASSFSQSRACSLKELTPGLCVLAACSSTKR